MMHYQTIQIWTGVYIFYNLCDMINQHIDILAISLKFDICKFDW